MNKHRFATFLKAMAILAAMLCPLAAQAEQGAHFKTGSFSSSRPAAVAISPINCAASVLLDHVETRVTSDAQKVVIGDAGVAWRLGIAPSNRDSWLTLDTRVAVGGADLPTATRAELVLAVNSYAKLYRLETAVPDGEVFRRTTVRVPKGTTVVHVYAGLKGALPPAEHAELLMSLPSVEMMLWQSGGRKTDNCPKPDPLNAGK
jgi:hypothetical protein